MTRRVFLAALLAETRAERGKKTLDLVINALGGANFLNMQNRVESGRAVTVDNDKLIGLSHSTIYTEYLRTGFHERQFFGGKSDTSILFTGGKGWSISAKGARPLDSETLERHDLSVRHNVFYILRMRLNEPGMAVELSGHEVVENQSTDVLDFYDSNNDNVTVWVNEFTHLPVRQRWYRRGDGYKDEELTHFTKYKDCNGIWWPMDLEREHNGAKVAVIYNETVKFNQSLKEDTFVLPAGIKLL
jgi:hypothetical protein